MNIKTYINALTGNHQGFGTKPPQVKSVLLESLTNEANVQSISIKILFQDGVELNCFSEKNFGFMEQLRISITPSKSVKIQGKKEISLLSTKTERGWRIQLPLKTKDLFNLFVKHNPDSELTQFSFDELPVILPDDWEGYF